MSATAVRRPVPRTSPSPGPGRSKLAAPKLRVLAVPLPRRGRLAYFALLSLILAGAMMMALLLNTQMAQGAYQLDSLRSQLTSSTVQEHSLETELARVSSAQALAEAATRLGMVPTPGLSFISLHDSTIVGPPAN